MNSSLILLIHAIVVVAFGAGGFLFGMTYTSAGIGSLIGLVAALALYYFWGKNAFTQT